MMKVTAAQNYIFAGGEEMKRFLAVVICLCTLLNFNFVTATPVTVTVSGESESGNETEALKDARRKAVRRVLSKMTSPNRDPESPFQKILLLFNDFSSNPQIIEKKTEGKTIFLVCKVQVDVDNLLQTVNGKIKSVQIANSDQQAVFLVRVKGLPTLLFQQRLSQVTKDFQDSFEQRGFTVASNVDELQTEFHKHDREEFDRFYRPLVSKIKTDYPEITLAIIGEIVFGREQDDETGLLIRSDVHISAVDILNDKLITKFSDVHKLKATKDSGEVFDALLRKSVFSSVAYLSDRTLSYWQNL